MKNKKDKVSNQELKLAYSIFAFFQRITFTKDEKKNLDCHNICDDGIIMDGVSV